MERCDLRNGETGEDAAQQHEGDGDAEVDPETGIARVLGEVIVGEDRDGDVLQWRGVSDGGQQKAGREKGDGSHSGEAIGSKRAASKGPREDQRHWRAC